MGDTISVENLVVLDAASLTTLVVSRYLSTPVPNPILSQLEIPPMHTGFSSTRSLV